MLTWSVTHGLFAGGQFDSNFNSHAHVERDKTIVNSLEEMQISTHTLTWSVTSGALVYDDKSHISTHTLTWSVTEHCVDFFNCFLHFNSHAHVERDAGNTVQCWRKSISTHTLTWSVTSCPACSYRR